MSGDFLYARKCGSLISLDNLRRFRAFVQLSCSFRDEIGSNAWLHERVHRFLVEKPCIEGCVKSFLFGMGSFIDG